MRVSIVIPCFNEEEGLPVLFKKLKTLQKKFLPKNGLEILFIDDGSNDKTYHLLLRFAETHNKVKVLKHQENRGLGAALRTGFKNAKGDVILTLDSDGTYDPLEIPNLVKMLGNKTLVVTASPYHPKGRCEGISRLRLFLSKGVSKIYRHLLHSNLYTFTSLFRAYQREVIEKTPFFANDFLAPTEILIKTLLKGYKVVEYPTTLVSRKYGQSKLKTLHTIRRHLQLIIQLVLGKIRREVTYENSYYLRDQTRNY